MNENDQDTSLHNQSGREGEPAAAVTTLTCIGCPMGCVIVVSADRQEHLTVVGAQCSRGEAYARAEVSRPTRVLTTLVAIPGCRTPLSVKTSDPIPRELLWKCLAEIHRIQVKLPVNRGDVLISNLQGTGSDVIATRTLKQSEETA